MMWETLEPLTDKERKLVEDNWPLALFFYKKLRLKYDYDEDILYDWVTEAAMRTAKAYDPAKGSWTALYNWKLRGVISHHYYTDTHRVKGASLDAEVSDKGKKNRLRHEVKGIPCRELDDALCRISAEQTMDSLSVTKNQQKYILDMVFGGENMNTTDLARKYGVRVQAVSDAVGRVKKKFRKAASKQGGVADWI